MTIATSDPATPPSPSALRRARDGAALNADEAAIAMTVRGDGVDDLCASAAGVCALAIPAPNRCVNGRFTASGPR